MRHRGPGQSRRRGAPPRAFKLKLQRLSYSTERDLISLHTGFQKLEEMAASVPCDSAQAHPHLIVINKYIIHAREHGIAHDHSAHLPCCTTPSVHARDLEASGGSGTPREDR